MGILMRRNNKIKEMANEIESVISQKIVNNLTEHEELVARKGVSSGSTLLNLALTDNPYVGYKLGTMVNIVGDSSAGKTFLLWTMYAEALVNPLFDPYRIINDEPESAFSIDERLFGDNTNRIVRNIRSQFIHELHKNILTEVNTGPFIYGLDSFDAISSKEEEERGKKLLKTGDIDGSYGMEKQKYAGILFRNILLPLFQTGSLLIIVSQTRHRIGASFGETKTRSGGDALRFYSTMELWLSVKGHIKRRDKDVGVTILCKIKKNKLTGKLRIIEFPIYFDYGVADIESMVDWLIDENIWGKSGHGIESKIFDKMPREKLITYIDSTEGAREMLVRAVTKEWYDIEESIRTPLKPKY